MTFIAPAAPRSAPAPRPPSPRPAAPADQLDPWAAVPAAERRAFFARLGWDGGKVEIVAGTNNPERPDQIDLITYDKATSRSSTRRWFSPDDLTGMERHTARLIASWGNVFVSVGSYDEAEFDGRPTYNRSRPRARQTILLDDVTDLGALRLAPSMATETSPGNYQVWLCCSDLLDPAEAAQLAAGAARIEGTDPTAAIAEKIGRIPGSLNTKPKCAGQAGNPALGQEPEGWTVRLRIANGATYTRAELCRAYAPDLLDPSAASGHQSRAGRADSRPPIHDDPAWQAALAEAEGYRGLLWKDGALWLGGPLLRTDGTIKALKPAHPINQVLLGERWADVAAKWDQKDPSGSGFEHHLTGALWLVGCPVPQIIATVEALSLDPQRKGTRWFTDTNLWGSLYGEKGWAILKPDIPRRPLRNFTPRPAALPIERGPGRPIGQRRAHATRLAELLADRVGEVVKRAQLAEQLGIAIRMIAYLLADLRDAGNLETEPAGQGFRVVRCAINCPAEVCNRSNQKPALESPIVAIATAENAPDAVPRNKEKEDHSPPALSACAEHGATSGQPVAIPVAQQASAEGEQGRAGGSDLPCAESAVAEPGQAPRRRAAARPTRGPGLPRSAWPTAAVTALEAERDRQLGMAQYAKNPNARRACAATAEALIALIRDRYAVAGIVLAVQCAPHAEAVAEAGSIEIAGAVAYAGGACFTPSGGPSWAELLTALAHAEGGKAAPVDEDAPPLRSLAEQQPLALPSALPIAPAPRQTAMQAAARRGVPTFRPIGPPSPTAGQRFTVVKCDHTGYVSGYGAYWLALGPDGETEPTRYADEAERDGERRWPPLGMFGD